MADTFLFAQVQPFSLAGAGAVAGATSVTLKSFTQIDGTLLTMADFGNIGYGTIEPGSGTLEEQISFTGVTQNSNGTATLTGVKSVGFVSPYTETSGLSQTHAGSTVFVISNTAGFYNRLTAKGDDETITGTWTFTNPNYPRMDTATPPPTDDEQLVTKKYVDDVAIAGGADASTTVKGISKLSVNPVSPTNPIAVGDNDTRVPPINTSTMTTGQVEALAGTSGTPSSSNKYVTDADTTGTGSVVRSSVLNSLLASTLFGDGSDGDVTISSNTSLSRDMFYNNLTIDSTKVLSTAGYRIYVYGTLTNNGTIRHNGSNATTYTGGAGAVSGTLAGGSAGGDGLTGTLSYGGGAGGGAGVIWIAANTIAVEGTIEAKGGNGANGVSAGGTLVSGSGNNGTAISKTLIQSGTGGAGGIGGSTTGGSGGTISSSNMGTKSPILMTEFIDTLAMLALAGGSGGGAGGVNSSGGSVGSGGGGGGQGGVIFEMYKTLTTSGTKTVTGGTGGTGAGAVNTNGSNGSSGLAISLQIV